MAQDIWSGRELSEFGSKCDLMPMAQEEFDGIALSSGLDMRGRELAARIGLVCIRVFADVL